MQNSQGKAIGFIRLPNRCPNLVFDGAKKNRLSMASSHSTEVGGSIPGHSLFPSNQKTLAAAVFRPK
ncbi:hypothetical protein [Agrobacterium vaccinii]|uniref:hypothetical protein n=1 Tax=Agrobacterium vaccinii TaxID=2735528 RepID=UPI001E5F0C31|nr:hypothetical protein [Agrobacterium vaccinii]